PWRSKSCLSKWSNPQNAVVAVNHHRQHHSHHHHQHSARLIFVSLFFNASMTTSATPSTLRPPVDSSTSASNSPGTPTGPCCWSSELFTLSTGAPWAPSFELRLLRFTEVLVGSCCLPQSSSRL